MSLEKDLNQFEEQGYLILPELLGPAEIREIVEALAPHVQGRYPGRNDFEGLQSERVYALLGKSPAFAKLLEHPRIVALLDRLLLPNYLLAAFLAILQHPGETEQELHIDDAFYKIPRPRPHVGITTIFALTDFTDSNGATELIPGSHKWGDTPPCSAEESERSVVRVRMPAGSCVLFSGSLYHRGGANRSSADRIAITPQYCQPWARPQENMFLAVPPAMARAYSPRVQSLLGYSMHPPFMGFVDGRHPLKKLAELE